MSYTDRHIVETYAILLEGLRAESKMELIERLSKSLQIEKAPKDLKFFKSFGAFSSEKSAEEVVADIKSSRTFIAKDNPQLDFSLWETPIIFIWDIWDNRDISSRLAKSSGSVAIVNIRLAQVDWISYTSPSEVDIWLIEYRQSLSTYISNAEAFQMAKVELISRLLNAA